MKKEKIKLISGLLGLSLFMTACSAPSYKQSALQDIAPEASSESSLDSEQYDGLVSEPNNEESGKIEKVDYLPEKLIKTGDISFDTENFDNSIQTIITRLKEHKGYQENTQMGQRGDGYYEKYEGEENYVKLRYATMTLRVPADNFDKFISDIKSDGIGVLTNENTSAEDVTKAYKDNQARISVLESKKERLQAMLDKADKTDDIISLENSLSETIIDIELLKQNNMSIDDKVSYSTITVSLNEVKRVDPLAEKGKEITFRDKAGAAWGKGIERFKNTVESFTLNAIERAIPLIISAIIAGGAVFLGIKYEKKKRIRKKNLLKDSIPEKEKNDKE